MSIDEKALAAVQRDWYMQHGTYKDMTIRSIVEAYESAKNADQPVELSQDATHAVLKHLKYRRCDDEYYLSRDGLAVLKGELLAIEIKKAAYPPMREVEQPVGCLSLPPAICTGCGQEPKVRVHLIGDIKICPECIHLMMNIVEREAPELATWANKRVMRGDENGNTRM